MTEMDNLKLHLGSTNCPKCSGRIYLDADEHGHFQHCLQCGYTKDLDVMISAGGINDREVSG
jgi:hypothetical protein